MILGVCNKNGAAGGNHHGAGRIEARSEGVHASVHPPHCATASQSGEHATGHPIATDLVRCRVCHHQEAAICRGGQALGGAAKARIAGARAIRSKATVLLAYQHGHAAGAVAHTTGRDAGGGGGRGCRGGGWGSAGGGARALAGGGRGRGAAAGGGAHHQPQRAITSVRDQDAAIG